MAETEINPYATNWSTVSFFPLNLKRMKTKRMEDLYTLVWWTVWEIPFLTTSFMYLMSIQMHTEGGCEIFWYFRRRICWPNGCGSCSEFSSIDDALHQNSLFLQDHWCFFLFGCFEASFERCKLSYLWTDPCLLVSFAPMLRATSQNEHGSDKKHRSLSGLRIRDCLKLKRFGRRETTKIPRVRWDSPSFLGRKFWVIRSFRKWEKLLR